jgi:hypothetical protein
MKFLDSNGQDGAPSWKITSQLCYPSTPCSESKFGTRVPSSNSPLRAADVQYSPTPSSPAEEEEEKRLQQQEDMFLRISTQDESDPPRLNQVTHILSLDSMSIVFSYFWNVLSC